MRPPTTPDAGDHLHLDEDALFHVVTHYLWRAESLGHHTPEQRLRGLVRRIRRRAARCRDYLLCRARREFGRMRRYAPDRPARAMWGDGDDAGLTHWAVMGLQLLGETPACGAHLAYREEFCFDGSRPIDCPRCLELFQAVYEEAEAARACPPVPDGGER